VRRSIVVLALVVGASACTSVVRQVAATLTAGPTSPASTPSAGPTSSRSIVVRVPRGGTEISSPVVVSGTAEIATGVLRVQVVDASGQVIAAADADLVCGLGCRGRFEARLAFVAGERQSGAIQLFQLDEGDGSVGHVATVPVTLVTGSG
jgi:Immunoglobulin-like domain of bacterial spore germination